MSPRIWYFPLESYSERYTAQLGRWTIGAFEKNGFEVLPIYGEQSPAGCSIPGAGPLDPVSRNCFALSQVGEFVRRASEVENFDILYFEDMFTPGFEAVPYLLQQLKKTVLVYGRNHAQSVDMYDFTFPMRHWMRFYEKMFCGYAYRLFVASEVHRELCLIAEYQCDVNTVGLPFDMVDVIATAPVPKPLHERSKRIVFSSRLDDEKQPWLFSELARLAQSHPKLAEYEFAFLTGKKMDSDIHLGLKLYSGLSKLEYYSLLADSRVHVNTALQDFISYTMLEASALGTPSIVPCFRGFPEAMFGARDQMYVPFNMRDCLEKVAAAEDIDREQIEQPARYNHETLLRISTQIFKDWKAFQ